MGNVSHLVTRTAAFESSVENGLAEGGSGKDRQFVTALARGLDILRAFHAGEGMLGNQEIAHRTGLPKPTVARLTHTLTELGYLNYIRRFRKYELGASVLALGYAAISSMDVRRASRQPLEQLALGRGAEREPERFLARPRRPFARRLRVDEFIR